MYEFVVVIIAIIAVFYYYIKRKKVPYTEFSQKIEPSDVTVNDVNNGLFKSRQYLPFRYPYHQTMALVKLDMNHWGMINDQYCEFHRQKREIFNGYDHEMLKLNDYYKKLEDDDTEAALVELRDFVMNHYSHRFPKLFKFSERGGKKVFINNLLKEEYPYEIMDALEVVTRIAMEDFYVCLKDIEKGQYKCAAVSVAFGGGGFPIVPLVGQIMDEIHKPVPYYETKLKKSMNKWFENFKDPVERASWHFVWDKKLDCSEFYEKLRELDEEKYCEYIKTIPFEQFEVRIEKQALIKLPKSKAIIFTNHPLFLNVKNELSDAPMVPSILLKMLYESPEDIIKQKHFHQLRDHLKGPLEKMIERQVSEGLIPSKDCVVRTVEGYPFRV